MAEKQKEMTVTELTAAIVPYIMSKNYSPSYIEGLQLILSRLNTYCDEKGITEFSTEVGQQFMREKYGVVSLDPKDNRRHSRLFRTMDMLSDFQHFGTVMIKRRLNRTFPEQFSQQAECYLSNMEKNYAQPNTILSHKKISF